MQIELKKFKEAKFASQETLCFQAEIYLDGIHSGLVANDGQGGANFYSNPHAEKAMNEYGATLPKHVVDDLLGKDGKPIEVGVDADILIGAAIDALQNKKMCARKTLFQKPGVSYAYGEYHTIAGKFSQETKAYLVQKYGPEVFILNENLDGKPKPVADNKLADGGDVQPSAGMSFGG
jgi:hypothetical protein